MRYLFYISVFTAISITSIVLQSLNFLNIEFVNPNLFLITIAALLIFYDRKDFFIIFAPVVILSLIWTVIFAPFWIEELIIIGILAVIFYFINIEVTGTKLVDMLFIVTLFTFIFYILLWSFRIHVLDWFIAGEILYNLLLTPLFYFIVRRVKHFTR